MGSTACCLILDADTTGFVRIFPELFSSAGYLSKKKKFITLPGTAQENAIRAAKEKTPCCQVDQAARGYIEPREFGKNFLNRTGHGIGFDAHEAFYMNARNTRPLKRGLAFNSVCKFFGLFQSADQFIFYLTKAMLLL